MSSNGATFYMAFCAACILVLKEFNTIVDEPYMDEPFHVPQAQAYCRGEWKTWDPKITTPPGLYVMSYILKRIFMFKCTLPLLRLTTVLSLLTLPIALTRLLGYHQRVRPPSSILAPTAEAVVLSVFPIAWFFSLLYYTDVPSLVLVVCTVVAASNGNHWLASGVGLLSCTFRQTNIVWVIYAYASSQLMYLRWRHARPGEQMLAKIHDPPALIAGPGDLVQSFVTASRVVFDILPSFIPYTLLLASFGAFVVWNRGIVLGDKSNHTPTLHVNQVYYFVAFSTLMGWPVLVSGRSGVVGLACDVNARMFGNRRRIAVTSFVLAVMALTVQFFTVHHPFLLSDNRHYTFYVWRHIFMFHPMMPYLFVPAYLACAWVWFLRIGTDQTLLQTLLLPVFLLPTLLPTPLLEPRYFLIPYILLRAQVVDVPTWGVMVEALWYFSINFVTVWVFLYKERAGVGRFMW